MATESSERYEYVRAIVGTDGELRWESKLVGNWRVACMDHDEDISDYTEDEIRDVTAAMFDVPADERDIIDVIYE